MALSPSILYYIVYVNVCGVYILYSDTKIGTQRKLFAFHLLRNHVCNGSDMNQAVEFINAVSSNVHNCG